MKYDYQELWRWQLILNRFALSPGNTIGITGAVVGENVDLYESAVFLNDLTEAAADSYSDYRETIHVWALDAQPVANALPTLLPLLGIPVDAVGVVGQFSSVPEPLIDPQRSTADFSEPGRTGIAADGSSPSQQLLSSGVDSSGVLSSDAPTDQTAVAGTGQRANSIVVMSASLVVGLAVLGGAGFIMIRRRRAMSPGV